jgi:hypothetical protein
MVLQGLKPRIFDKLNKHGKKWAAELPSILWSLRTTPSRATGFIPFFLVYGSEAMLPTDVEYGPPRLKAYNEKNNDTTREDALDQLEEARDVALLHSARYQQSLRRYHDRHVYRRDLNVGDLVRRQSQNTKGRHKLTPPWEGPYIIAEVLKLAPTNYRTRKARYSPTPRTLNNYVAFLPKASRLCKLFRNPMIE